ncbi:PAP2 superfamily protein [Corynebacterium urogenitale]|uniref:PAP2 superfamily protein n=1 Tax=Corynebacterium urogenitale TaxID=2487892 RepID=A0A5J6Z8F2_9CORY|nr:phosphatase PAP2 family protein [Corynebacterium urogenitale]QFQ01913.1 PAP2 superfamily protein [Corynebacterium urogenitale]
MKLLPIKLQLIIALIGMVIVIALGFAVKDSTFDLPLTQAMNSLNVGVFGDVVNFVYGSLQPIFSFGFCAAGVIIYVVRRHPWRPLISFAATVIFAWLPIVFLKKFYQRPRIDPADLPNPGDYVPHDWSYPSGHTAFVTAVVVALLLATHATKAHNIARILGAVFTLIIIGCVMTVGVHYFTDALASVIWAFTVGPVGWMIFSLIFSSAEHMAKGLPTLPERERAEKWPRSPDAPQRN